MVRAFLVWLTCCICWCAVASAQDIIEDWYQYKIDDKVSIGFPCEIPNALNWVDSTYRCGDSTFRMEAHVIDLSEDIAGLGKMDEKELAEHVYVTQLEKMSRYSMWNLERKLWRWKKQNFVMVLWYPRSHMESQFYSRIRTYPWGPDAGGNVLPPFTRYERMLFLNNKLYIFSMTTISEAYHDNWYFRLGGRTAKEVLALKERFFHSIDIKK